MTGRPLRFISVLSLFLCLVTCAVWARSYGVAEGIHHGSGLRVGSGEQAVDDWYADSSRGSVDLKWLRARAAVGPITNVTPAGWQYRILNPRFIWRPPASWLGFSLRSERYPATGGNYHEDHWVRLPYWSAVLASAAVALLASSLRRTLVGRIRRLHDLCPSCGYDLRASPSRCPECGAAAISPHGA